MPNKGQKMTYKDASESRYVGVRLSKKDYEELVARRQGMESVSDLIRRAVRTYLATLNIGKAKTSNV